MRLREIMSILGLTQTDFGNRIFLTNQAISSYVKDRNPIPEPIALLIEKVFGVDKTWLLTGEGEMWYNPPLPDTENLQKDMMLIRKILRDPELRPLMEKVVDLKKAEKEKLYDVLRAFLK